MIQSEFLDFEVCVLRLSDINKKTKIYTVKNKSNGGTLGWIKWYGPWRKYVFNTECAIFDVKCLTDIIAFISGLMEERKNERSKDNS